jgi:hypothetical protein
MSRRGRLGFVAVCLVVFGLIVALISWGPPANGPSGLRVYVVWVKRWALDTRSEISHAILAGAGATTGATTVQPVAGSEPLTGAVSRTWVGVERLSSNFGSQHGGWPLSCGRLPAAGPRGPSAPRVGR